MEYAIGTKFITGGKAKRACTVTDILKTYNSAGELVGTRYVATHEFMGQIVTDRDVCSVTIAKGLEIPAKGGVLSIFDCITYERVSDRSYATVNEANHDCHMNAGHTYIGVIGAQCCVRCMFCGAVFPCDPRGMTAARKNCGVHGPEEVALIHRALLSTITDMGQLAGSERRILAKAVKRGILSKGKGGPYPILKTIYARPGFDFARDREAGVAELMRAHMVDIARGE